MQTTPTFQIHIICRLFLCSSSRKMGAVVNTPMQEMIPNYIGDYKQQSNP